MPSWPSATVSEDHGFRVWGAAISPDGRRAMTWVQHGMGADRPGSPPRERTFNPGRAQANTRVSADAAPSLVLPCYADPAPC